MRLWLNIESGLEFEKYTFEAGFYLLQWKVSYTKTKGGLTTIRLGPLYVSVWNNEEMRAWFTHVLENNPIGPRDED